MKEKGDFWTSYIQLGLELSISVLAFSAIGYWLDIKFSSKPWLTLSGSFIGIVSVFYILWKNFLRGKNG